MPTPETPWRTVKEAAARAKTGVRVIYREVAAGRLKAARVGGRRDIRLLDRWVDQWLEDSMKPKEVVQTPVVQLVPKRESA
jgi:excisionase family DNA binding protein